MRTNTDNERLVRITDKISVFYEIDRKHYFLMRTSQVAKACGIRISSVDRHIKRQRDHVFIENEHFVIKDSVLKWTRQGMIVLCWRLNRNSNKDIILNWLSKGFKHPNLVNEYIKLSDKEIIDIDQIEYITISREQLHSILSEIQLEVRKSILTKLLSYDTANKNKRS